MRFLLDLGMGMWIFPGYAVLLHIKIQVFVYVCILNASPTWWLIFCTLHGVFFEQVINFKLC